MPVYQVCSFLDYYVRPSSFKAELHGYPKRISNCPNSLIFDLFALHNQILVVYLVVFLCIVTVKNSVAAQALNLRSLSF